jgi:hypothetical protein
MPAENLNVTTVERVTGASPAAIWDVLADGWAYAGWVVGASRVRDVDVGWPAPGARIHHSVGLWPLLIDDTTLVERSTPGCELVLTARGWPAGEARVVMTVEPSGEGCLVRMDEDAVRGPGLLVPKPFRQALIAPRNHESLRRLEYLAVGRQRRA